MINSENSKSTQRTASALIDTRRITGDFVIVLKPKSKPGFSSLRNIAKHACGIETCRLILQKRLSRPAPTGRRPVAAFFLFNLNLDLRNLSVAAILQVQETRRVLSGVRWHC